MDLKVMIADDDAGMRLLLKKAIEKKEGFKLVAEAEDGAAALHFVESRQPQVIFMDVEMPGLDGIECAKRVVDINPKTFILFATAHEEYMSEAFELYAFDYLVKPFKMERVHQTLERIKELSDEREHSPILQMQRHEKGLAKLLIKNKESISLVDMEDILLIQREDRSTAIYTPGERYVTSEALSDIEKKLDKSIFFRSHKSYIINLSMVHKIYPYGRWTYVVKLKGTDRDALLTHDRYEDLQEVFKG